MKCSPRISEAGQTTVMEKTTRYSSCARSTSPSASYNIHRQSVNTEELRPYTKSRNESAIRSRMCSTALSMNEGRPRMSAKNPETEELLGKAHDFFTASSWMKIDGTPFQDTFRERKREV